MGYYILVVALKNSITTFTQTKTKSIVGRVLFSTLSSVENNKYINIYRINMKEKENENLLNVPSEWLLWFFEDTRYIETEPETVRKLIVELVKKNQNELETLHQLRILLNQWEVEAQGLEQELNVYKEKYGELLFE